MTLPEASDGLDGLEKRITARNVVVIGQDETTIVT
jgi:hypothetical protein